VTENNLHNTEWDCLVVGNGVTALWLSHFLWSSKKSVLWITSEDPYSPERAMLQHAWQWGVSQEKADLLTSQLTGFHAEAELPEFEMIYFDARSSHKRFRKLQEAKKEWGDHEKEYFDSLCEMAAKPDLRDLWAWHSKLHAFHDNGKSSLGPTQVELFTEPRFVRMQGWPLIEFKTLNNKLSSVVLSGLKPTDEVEVKAKHFFISDFDDYLPSLVKNQADSESLAAALKRRAFRAGFGLRLWHKELESTPTQTAVIPLVVSPNSKGEGSHVVGRFVRTERGLESLWIGLLTDEELEDNNEILKKIKLTKRAVDRAIPGFSDSITREAVTFEPRMRGTDLVKNKKAESLGAFILSDYQGPEAAAESLKKIFATKTDQESKPEAPRQEMSL
jgi:hypothetical protein